MELKLEKCIELNGLRNDKLTIQARKRHAWMICDRCPVLIVPRLGIVRQRKCGSQVGDTSLPSPQPRIPTLLPRRRGMCKYTGSSIMSMLHRPSIVPWNINRRAFLAVPISRPPLLPLIAMLSQPPDQNPIR